MGQGYSSNLLFSVRCNQYISLIDELKLLTKSSIPKHMRISFKDFVTYFRFHTYSTQPSIHICSFAGLNIKCMQIAQRVLGIPLDQITIYDADTTRTPNAPPTGGSQGTDVYGLAVKVISLTKKNGIKICNPAVQDRNTNRYCSIFIPRRLFSTITNID